jgi:hypothetical protein
VTIRNVTVNTSGFLIKAYICANAMRGRCLPSVKELAVLGREAKG